jgi:predicted transcriptional regulator
VILSAALDDGPSAISQNQAGLQQEDRPLHQETLTGYYRPVHSWETAMNATAKKPDPRREAYEAWYDEQVRLGLEDIEAGRVVSHESVVKKSAALLKQLEKKHGKKAA